MFWQIFLDGWFINFLLYDIFKDLMTLEIELLIVPFDMVIVNYSG